MTGIKKISFITVSDVTRLTQPKNGQIGVVLRTGTVWATIDFEPHEADFIETTSIDDTHGEYYKPQLSFEIYKDRTEIVNWIYETRNRLLTAKIEYRSGLIKLAYGLTRQIKSQSGRGKGSQNKVVFTFSGENTQPSFELISETYQ